MGAGVVAKGGTGVVAKGGTGVVAKGAGKFVIVVSYGVVLCVSPIRSFDFDSSAIR
jgi:hypothetical protein